jgi:transposase
MQQRQLEQLYMERQLHLLRTLNLVQKDEAVAVDSMPLSGAGQVLDTYNLLGAGIRVALRTLGEHTGQGTAQVAKRLGMQRYLERSIKGNAGLGIDWESEAGRRALLEKLVQDALRLQQEIAHAASGSAKPEPATDSRAPEHAPEPPEDGGAASASVCDSDSSSAAQAAPTAVQQAAAQLEQILLHDVEFSADGKVLGIRQQAAGDRLISVTDPDMRHGRKSASVLIAGYKVQVVASVLFGFILLTRVMRANRPDGQALPGMLDALRARGFLPKAVLGDHAYGTLANHHDIQRRRQQGQDIELYARMPRPENGGRLTKDQFEVDFEKRQLRCPAGQLQPLSRYASREGRSGWLFEFPAATCGNCPRQKQCVSPKSKDGARSVFVIPEDERLIRAHLVRRKELDFIAVLAERPAVERVQAGLVQCGGKTVHRVGLPMVDFDVALSALTHNLRRLGSLLKQQPELLAQLQQEADRHKAAQRLLFMCLLLAALWLCRCRRTGAVPAVWDRGCVRAIFLLPG